MEVTPITPEEFPSPKHKGKPRRFDSSFDEAVSALEVGDGFSTPCIWEHVTRQPPPSQALEARKANRLQEEICPARAYAHLCATNLRRAGGNQSLRTDCKDGILYVLRAEDRVSFFAKNVKDSKSRWRT